MRGRRVRYAVSVVVAGSAAAVALAGCGGGDKEPLPSSSSTTASPSGSPTPSAAPVPEPAKQRTEGGAIEFMRFYVDEGGRVQTAPGTVDFAPLGLPGCTACEASAQLQRDYVSEGWYTKEPSLRIANIAVRGANVDGEETLVDFTFTHEPIPYFIKGQGEKPAGDVPAESGSRVAALRWVDGGWKIRDIGTR